MKGKLYVVGVGPGDPELLTIKAMRVLRKVPCICVPKGREEGSSLALSIVSGEVDLSSKEIVEAHFPMKKTKNEIPPTHPSPSRGEGKGGGELDAKWQETAEIILSRLDKGIDVAFITIGDPTIYSTFFYLYDRLLEADPGLDIEIIPGVSSITAAASRAGLSLGLADEKIAVVPATYSADEIREIIGRFDTVVLMKVHKVFDEVRRTLEEMNLLGKAVYIARAGREGEKIIDDITALKKDDLDYFSLVVVKK